MTPWEVTPDIYLPIDLSLWYQYSPTTPIPTEGKSQNACSVYKTWLDKALLQLIVCPVPFSLSLYSSHSVPEFVKHTWYRYSFNYYYYQLFLFYIVATDFPPSAPSIPPHLLSEPYPFILYLTSFQNGAASPGHQLFPCIKAGAGNSAWGICSQKPTQTLGLGPGNTARNSKNRPNYTTGTYIQRAKVGLMQNPYFQSPCAAISPDQPSLWVLTSWPWHPLVHIIPPPSLQQDSA